MDRQRRWRVGAATFFVCLVPASASAGDPSSTEEHRALMISAQVMRKEGKLLRSRDLLASCGAAACSGEASECTEIRSFCERKLTEVVSEIPTATFRVEDDRGRPVIAEHIELDASTVDAGKPIMLDPGTHRVKAFYAGRTGEAPVVIAPGQKNVSAVVRIDLRETIQTRPIPVPVFVLGGAFVVGGGISLGTGIYTAHGYGNLDNCRPYCPSTQRSTLETTAVVADISFVIALASAVAGTIWFLARPNVEEVRWRSANQASR